MLQQICNCFPPNFLSNIEKVAIEENIENIEKVARKKHRHK